MVKNVVKVVRIIDNRYKSLYDHGKYSIDYKLQERIYPDVGYIFAFDNEDSARNYVNQGYIKESNTYKAGHVVLLSGVADVWDKEIIFHCPDYTVYPSFWHAFNQEPMTVKHYGLEIYSLGYRCKHPEGTVLCKWLLPERIIRC